MSEVICIQQEQTKRGPDQSTYFGNETLLTYQAILDESVVVVNFRGLEKGGSDNDDIPKVCRITNNSGILYCW